MKIQVKDIVYMNQFVDIINILLSTFFEVIMTATFVNNTIMVGNKNPKTIKNML